MSRRDGPIRLDESDPGRDLRSRAASGVFWTAASNWGNELSRLLIFIVLSRLLEPKHFGLVALAIVFIGFTQVIADQGMADALVQRKRLDPAHLDSAFWMSMGVGFALAALLAALAVPIAAVLDEPALALVLVALAVGVPINSLSLVQRAGMTRALAFRSLAMRTLISIAVGGVCAIAAALAGLGVWALVVQHLVTPVVAVIVLWSVSDWRPRFRFSSAHFGELFGFGISVVGFRLLNYFTRRSDELFIGTFLGPAALGFYTVGHRMVRLIFQVTSSLVDRVAFPVYSRLQDEPERLRRAFYKSTSFAALVAFPAFVGSLVMAPEIVRTLFGPQWADSVPVMRLLALLGVIQVLTYLNSIMVKSLGKPSWQVGIVAMTALLKISAFLVAVQWGIVAVAFAAVCVGYAMAPIWYWSVKRLAPIGVRAYLSHVRGPFLAAVSLAVALVGLRELLGDAHPALTLAVASAVGAVVYLAAIRLFAPKLTNEGRELIRRALPRRGRREPGFTPQVTEAGGGV
jgi:O-antigen/teichoic acid export membrane protein